MNIIRIISSPATEYEVIKETTPYAPDGEVYFIQGGKLAFTRTQEQSEERIKGLEAELSKLNKRMSDILDILDPDRHDRD
jgi:hypothetical protein